MTSRTVTVTDAANPTQTVSTTVTGADVVAGATATEPLVVGLDFTSLLSTATSVVVSISATRGTSEGAHGGFGVESVEAGLTDSEMSTYAYGAAGRMVSRTVGSVTTAMGWDPLSNLTSTSTPADSRLYAYDASGQRVAQIVVDEVSPDAVAEKVTAYVGDLEVTDTSPGTTGGLTATRFLTFGGATVATVTTGSPTPSWSLLLGDGQGSAQVAMELVPVASGTGLAAASSAHAVTRNAYLPFGATRGADQLATSRGWLGQVADTDTGLIYLNARYYDPVLARFVSPDPLMNPGDPKTLDPYRYADNNPVMMTDATGLYSTCVGLGYNKMMSCMLKSRASEIQQANPGILTKAPGPGTRSGYSPRDKRTGIATAEYLSLMARADDLDWRSNASGLQLGAQWAAGGRVLTSPGNFYDGDRIVESLKQSDHYQLTLPAILAQAESEGGLFEGEILQGRKTRYNHAAGAPWWAKPSIASRDMQAALTGEHGGTYNEALTFLGSHSVDVTIRSVDRHVNGDGSTTVRVSVGIVARNDTTVESFARAASDNFGEFAQGVYDQATGGSPLMPAATRSQELRFSMSYVFTTGAG